MDSTAGFLRTPFLPPTVRHSGRCMLCPSHSQQQHHVFYRCLWWTIEALWQRLFTCLTQLGKCPHDRLMDSVTDRRRKHSQSTKGKKRLAVLLKSAQRIVYSKLKSVPNCFLSRPSTDTIFATDCIKPPRSPNNLEINPSPLPVEMQTKSFQLLPDCNTPWFPIATVIIQHLCKLPKDCYSQSYSTFVKHNGVFGSGPCPANLFIHALSMS